MGWTAWTSTLTWTTLGEVMGPSRASWEPMGQIVEPAKLVWKLQGKATNSPWSSQPKESTKEVTKIPNWPSSNWIHTRTRNTTAFWLTEADGNDGERVLPTKRGGPEVGKERGTRVSLISCRTKRQWQAEQISHRKQHCHLTLREQQTPWLQMDMKPHLKTQQQS